MDRSLYEKPLYTDSTFPIRISYEQHRNNRVLFQNHWHEQLEFLYIIEGRAHIRINSETYEAVPQDLFIFNSNDLHYGEGISNNVSYYCMIVEPSVLHNNFIEDYQTSTALERYSSSYILLNRHIKNDTVINSFMKNMMNEQQKKEPGYELFVKSIVHQLIGYLIRNHDSKSLSSQKYNMRLRNLNRLNKVIEYIDENYNEQHSVEEMAQLANLSTYYFCRLFKSATGKSLVQYINDLRIEKAHYLLMNTDMNITEIALQTGFTNVNYFSRYYKNTKHISPSSMRKE
ncbi:AraC family transcriptional regulator [Fredinandcohnia quinoae]|uniref:AraC family transcriptional regulator n=1 Tax=Fredinandcohnia quinoae TaxID=2918902 RepID=A0AAW5E233_9BACI|nr:AraC family transcriptional regulator [Fredinandcohnia sp. SECRCQ15]MCH1624132.1 AraC family transcriptional regulator [Fredinandcohnia sp. SECRCQ15]